MTKAITVKNITFQEGTTLICVPLIGKTLDELKTHARTLADAGADLIEWRVDHFTGVRDDEQIRLALTEIRQQLATIPLLFTFRSHKEGGETELDDDAYFALNRLAVASGLVDLIDIELFNEETQIRALVAEAHAAGVKVIMSNHDFQKTPPQNEIVDRLCRMQELGADLPKIAVMPQSPQDVLTLLGATLTMKEQHATRPLITMSMGKMGGVSRVTGRLFGSAMTFGSVGQASAPGQIAVGKLRELMDILS
ncbi:MULTISPECIES: type I 3-dehydroquinate dehydratase [Enterobacteriaceae]|uniref:3-dehydroquinate dehydratase n=1 Tax=Raoultella lignicola TaxID=3040939 RepID=A0ABU9F6E9_9ENTR|nr:MULTISPECIES: type I 3-dehydroquinate dehydratase [Enterobacteriaceae]MRT50445.1 type I 3-dehydroquinate dehydratase [Raoultella sp. RIT712]QNK06049.1 type I 3-dehydroquinate dehydratase [Enterobacter sp. JUb54]ROS07885.1 3-dehydroquinate dehydratase [Raoultella sp. BIGb0399]